MSTLASAALAKARIDLVTFAQLVGRDERTGKRIDLQPFQSQILRAFQAEPMVAVFAGAELGKSYLSALNLAWRIGRDPTERCAIVSAYALQAERIFRLTVGIMSGQDYQLVFPNTKIDRVTSDELVVHGRPQGMKDPNLRASGYSVSSTLSSRIDYVVNDEITSRESLHSQQNRDRASIEYSSVILSRLSPNARMVMVNTREHHDDLPSRLIQLPGWKVLSFPILDEQGQSIWPERWPLDRIEKRRRELGERRFLTCCMCQPVPEGAGAFAEEDIARALSNGLAVQHSGVPDGPCLVSVDPAWTTKSTSDESAITMITLDSDGYRHLLLAEGWRISAEHLVSRVVSLCLTNRATCAIEQNAAGQVLSEMIGKSVPCKAYPTTKASKEFRVEALSSELASGKWIFRQPLGYPGPELKKLVSDLHTFSWDAHTGDRLSALLVGVEAAKALANRPKGRCFRVDLVTR